ncbi:MAG: DUF1127 domain-containing protein [Paracoccaceae bacterium]
MKTITLRTSAGLPSGASVLSTIARWSRVANERRRLAALGPARLDDLGISAAERDHEAARPFWDSCRGL